MARDYDPPSGRYIESDPTGLYGGSWSPYLYASGNPLSRRDPLGLWDWPSLPQGFVNASAGLGDALLLNQGARLRRAWGINGGVNSCSASYQGGQLAGILGTFLTGEGEINLAFKTEHYGARLIEAGVDVNAAEAAVAADLRALESITEGQLIKGQVSVDGQLLNYHAMPLPTGQVSVGTIHVPW